MFIGHFALGFGAKRLAPTVSLGVLFLACQLADLLWPTLLLLGLETAAIHPGDTVFTPLHFIHYPYSHSLAALLLWAGLLSLGYRLLRKSSTRSALVIGALVISHWVLDVLTHRPDMPLSLTGGSHVGLGLWNSRPGTMVFEILLFAAGFALYSRWTEASDRKGSLGLWGLALFLLAIYVANGFGPPPPSVQAVAWSAEAMWLLVAWGFWVDRHRRAYGIDSDSGLVADRS